ncbi:FadR/GntR family transcriptional regulator [Desulforamulus hydrothermalis]|uniref:HTH-type transcriptional regulator lutR n=1 Tax=Desulforamulus hydrothermalis Lam5 = DSM 18033 TaxID=1121428 RepID=K8DWV6_9FIRM|nr:FadR/GntR family transcriptional regulator [Desulforamulus hydrothermalis]CCO06967.1 HTH-type transcriptional regulator lutR [Desulforamulus hydrothermalis Lam5 = DSM 18033]SHG98606.1 transcriptional regulator, GntR family [Desulforamulus hydrothermalis Lam5 = DSM 18033]
MEFRPIKTKKIYEEIVEQIKQMIARGELTPGDKLLPERELADRLQVGRSAVREAYRALEAIGVIEIRPGEGTFVRELGTKCMTDIMSLAVSTGKDTLFELLELRKIIETEAAALAAMRRTKEDLKNIKYWLDKMNEDINQGSLGDLSDIKFHYAIAAAAHNSLLMKIMNSISETMKREMKVVRQKLYLTPGTPRSLYEQHLIIYDAIVSGDEAKAREAMLMHLNRAEKGLIQNMNITVKS